MELAPIVLFVYNRPEHTQKTLAHLQQNKLAGQSQLFIFSDGPKNSAGSAKVEEVRAIIRSTTGFLSVSIIEQKQNFGLATSVINGVSKVLESHSKVIVLEDDLISAPDFLDFMNHTLETYKNEQKIFSVSGYSYPLDILKKYPFSGYFSHRGSSWSWGTWADRWFTIDWEVKDRATFSSNSALQKEFNQTCGPDLSNMLMKQFNGEIDSWAVRFAYDAFKQKKLHVLAAKNKINNIGHDNSGTHSPKTDKYTVPLVTESKYTFPSPIQVVPAIKKALLKFHTKHILIRLIRKFFPLKR